MKTKIMTFLLLLCSSLMFAQGPWFTNGNVIGATNFLGTNNNQPLNFRTNGVNRAHINPNRTQTIIGYTFNANGYMGLGENSVALKNKFVCYNQLL